MRLFVLSLAVLLAAACGKEDKSEDGAGKANVKLSMSDGSTLRLVKRALGLATETNIAPDEFVVKIISVELVNAENRYVNIWTGTGCTPKKVEYDGGKKDEEGNTVNDFFYNAENCLLSDITEGVDLAQPIADVNQELNSQAWPVPADTYTQVSIRMCQPEDTAEDKAQAIEFIGGDMSESHTFGNGSCGVTGAPVSNMVIAEGDDVTIDLQYDQESLLSKGTHEVDVSAQYSKANTTGECILGETNYITYCGKFGATTFVPSIVE